MTDGVDDLDTDYFQTLTEQITGRDDWSFTENQRRSVDQAVEDAANGDTAEIEFLHNETGSTLVSEIPGPGLESAFNGILRQSIIPEPAANRTPKKDSFHFKLEEAYNSIAENHSTEYLSPILGRPDQPNYTLLKFTVPWDYDNSALDTALDELTEASREAYQLNSDIQQPVQEYLE
jgi:hypothetical protein